jgi:hypothetical protein
MMALAATAMAFAAASGIHPLSPTGTVPREYRFGAYFANRPGTYYWQAVRIACSGGDCRQEGPVTRFTVR